MRRRQSSLGAGRLRARRDGSNQIIVEVGRPQREWVCSSASGPVVIPGILLEPRQMTGLAAKKLGICSFGLPNRGEKLLGEETGDRLGGLEGPDPSQHLAAIVPRHSYGGDLTGRLVDVEVRGTAHVRASVGQVHGPLRIAWKTCQELLAYADDVVGLAAHAGHFSGHEDVLRVAEHPGEGVTGQGLGGRVQLRHDHPRIQTAGERDPDLFAPFEVPRQIAREDVADLPIVDVRLEPGLALPLVGVEVRAFRAAGVRRTHMAPPGSTEIPSNKVRFSIRHRMRRARQSRGGRGSEPDALPNRLRLRPRIIRPSLII